MKTLKSIEIAAPPNRIWPFFVDPDKVLQWCITFRKFKYTSDRRGGGAASIYIEEQAGGPLMKLYFQIAECSENEMLALRMVSGTGVKSYEQSWSVEAIPAGSRFTFREEIELPLGVIGKLLSPILERMSAATVDKMLIKLKALAEASAN